MPRKRFTNEQIAFALRQAENGATVDEVCRKMGVSVPTFRDLARLPDRKTMKVEILKEALGRQDRATQALALSASLCQHWYS